MKLELSTFTKYVAQDDVRVLRRDLLRLTLGQLAVSVIVAITLFLLYEYNSSAVVAVSVLIYGTGLAAVHRLDRTGLYAYQILSGFMSIVALPMFIVVVTSGRYHDYGYYGYYHHYQPTPLAATIIGSIYHFAQFVTGIGSQLWLMKTVALLKLEGAPPTSLRSAPLRYLRHNLLRLTIGELAASFLVGLLLYSLQAEGIIFVPPIVFGLVQGTGLVSIHRMDRTGIFLHRLASGALSVVALVLFVFIMVFICQERYQSASKIIACIYLAGQIAACTLRQLWLAKLDETDAAPSVAAPTSLAASEKPVPATPVQASSPETEMEEKAPAPAPATLTDPEGASLEAETGEKIPAPAPATTAENPETDASTGLPTIPENV